MKEAVSNEQETNNNENKVITGTQMREIADKQNALNENIEKTITDKLDMIYNSIQYSAKRGEYCIEVAEKISTASTIIERVVSHLRSNGFEVKMGNYTDNYIKIFINW